MENSMKRPLSRRSLALGIVVALGAAAIVATAQATKSSKPTTPRSGTVALGKTALGTILVDSRGHTLYLFEKDRHGVSMCGPACKSYWPLLTSRRLPRAGKGVHQSLLRLGRAHNGVRQVVYAGHPLYTFVGDKRAGQTTGEGLSNFGAEWDALSAGGQKVEQSTSTSTGGYGSGGGY
jgi:predicted lipoprotein with Yx(FWY)xxD motif